MLPTQRERSTLKYIHSLPKLPTITSSSSQLPDLSEPPLQDLKTLGNLRRATGAPKLSCWSCVLIRRSESLERCLDGNLPGWGGWPLFALLLFLFVRFLLFSCTGRWDIPRHISSTSHDIWIGRRNLVAEVHFFKVLGGGAVGTWYPGAPKCHCSWLGACRDISQCKQLWLGYGQLIYDFRCHMRVPTAGTNALDYWVYLKYWRLKDNL